MLRLHAIVASVAFVCLTGVAATAEDALPIDLQPYRVVLSVAYPASPQFGRAYRDETSREVERLLDRTIGERWTLTATSDPGMPRDFPALARWKPSDVPAQRNAPRAEAVIGLPADAAPDKILAVVLETQGATYQISVREWDRLTDSLGSVRTKTTLRRADVARTIVAALFEVFRPVAMVGTPEETNADIVPLTLRAASIPTPDPAVGHVAPGTLFLPQLRRFDRDGGLEQVRPIPYTLLQVAQNEGGRVTAVIHSALRSSLGSRRGRVEAWATAAAPTGTATTLTLVREDDGVPLAGRIVEVRPEPFAPGQEEPPAALSLLTDRSGSVSLPVDPQRSISWITLRSGSAVLMRFPLAPGLEPVVTLRLGDDARRLDAEGRLAILTGELIETVAKRATLLARARGGARGGRYTEAESALAEAAKLPDAAAFRRRIAAVEVPAAKAAEDAGDRLAAARIRALGRKATGLVDRYLNADSLRATREEVEELKRTDPDRDKRSG